MTAPGAWLLDANVLYAPVEDSHVNHAAARTWFGSLDAASRFATCPITEGALVRLAMRIGGRTADVAWRMLAIITDHPRHAFWPDSIGYSDVSRAGLLGHRQVTDAYLLALARHHAGRLATFDRGLVALYPNVAGSAHSPAR